MTDHVTSSLRKLRADLVKEYDMARVRMVAIGAELRHVDAVMRMYDPDHVSKLLQVPDHVDGVLPRGERTRAILGAMREAGQAISAAEITRVVMLHAGHDPDDRGHRRVVSRKVEAALHRQERQGVLRSIRSEGAVILWEVVN